MRTIPIRTILLGLLAGCGSQPLGSTTPDGGLNGTGNGGAIGSGGVTGVAGGVAGGGGLGRGGAPGGSMGSGVGGAGTTGTGGGGAAGTSSGGRGGTGGTGGPGGGGAAGTFSGGGGVTGGTGGVGGGGAGGVGASSGRGGSNEYCGGIMPAVPPLCPSLCGNGVRDTCPARFYGFCQGLYWTESCDGTDFGTDSCQAHGFASGALTCAADCAIADSGCEECLPLDSSLVRCGKSPVGDVKQGALAVAATDAAVGLGWLEYDVENRATISFARLSPALDPIGVTVLDDHVPPPNDYHYAFNDIAAAPLPSGWVVAVCGFSELSLRAMGADGAETGRVVVDTLPDGTFPSYPVLATGPAGGPLLVWTTETGMRASVIAADGRSATTPVDLPTSDVNSYSVPSAAFVGDAFYVVFAIQPVSDMPALRLARLTLDGTVASVVDALPGQPIWAADLAAGAGELRITYSGPASGVLGDELTTLWRRLDSAGAPLTPQVVLGGHPMGFGPSYAFGDDTVLLIFGLHGSSISFTRIALDGSIVTPLHDIVQAPYLGYRAARRGPDLIVAWMGARGLQIARVTP